VTCERGNEVSTERPEHCGRCRFWDPEDEREGTCRRHAPRPAGVVIKVSGRKEFSYQEFPVWPLTLAHEWCGEFRPVSRPDDDTPVETLGLSARSRKLLFRTGVANLGQLTGFYADELLEFPNFGRLSLNEIRDKLAQRGLKLRGE
jgi:hypothetical protein